MGKTVLVVDDDEDILYLYRLIFEEVNVTVYTSSSVDDALNLVKTVEGLDMVILDYCMPTFRGDQLAKEINKISPQVKIVFISGHSDTVDALKRLNVEVCGVYRKPVDPDFLEKIPYLDDHTQASPDSTLATNLYSNI